MRWKLHLLLALIGLPVSLGLGSAEAQVGVGVNVGRIQVDQPLFGGRTYQLPPVGVVNTGHVAGEYSLRVVHLYDQEELRPAPDWFSFEPDRFYLEPGITKDVEINLRIPASAQPGDYFTFIEAYRLASDKDGHGGLALQVAAATKLTFTVKARRCGTALMSNKWLKWPASPSGAPVDSSVSLWGQDALGVLSSIRGDDSDMVAPGQPVQSQRPGVSGANKCGGDYPW